MFNLNAGLGGIPSSLLLLQYCFYCTSLDNDVYYQLVLCLFKSSVMDTKGLNAMAYSHRAVITNGIKCECIGSHNVAIEKKRGGFTPMEKLVYAPSSINPRYGYIKHDNDYRKVLSVWNIKRVNGSDEYIYPVSGETCFVLFLNPEGHEDESARLERAYSESIELEMNKQDREYALGLGRDVSKIERKIDELALLGLGDNQDESEDEQGSPERDDLMPVFNLLTRSIMLGRNPIWYDEQGYGEVSVNGARVRFSTESYGSMNYNPLAYGYVEIPPIEPIEQDNRDDILGRVPSLHEISEYNRQDNDSQLAEELWEQNGGIIPELEQGTPEPVTSDYDDDVPELKQGSPESNQDAPVTSDADTDADDTEQDNQDEPESEDLIKLQKESEDATERYLESRGHVLVTGREIGELLETTPEPEQVITREPEQDNQDEPERLSVSLHARNHRETTVTVTVDRYSERYEDVTVTVSFRAQPSPSRTHLVDTTNKKTDK